MNEQQLREWEQEQQVKAKRPKMQRSRFGVLQFDPQPMRKEAGPAVSRQQKQAVRGALRPQRVQQRSAAPSQKRHARIHQRQDQVAAREHADARVQHEMQEMRETHDLRDVDDDVEDVATLYAWQALEHTHRPKSQRWYVVLAASITAVVVGFILMGNIIGAITIAFAGGFVYWVAQREASVVLYRILTEGVAFNTTLYHFQDLEAFNIVYEPGEVKTVILRSKRTFSPLLHMEIGEADPVAIRDILLEFVPEDQDLHEPLVDIYARRLGF